MKNIHPAQKSNYCERRIHKFLAFELGLALTFAATLPFPTSALSAQIVCDGKTDQTAQLNSLLQQGGVVIVPAGTCIISGTLNIPSYTTLTGQGMNQTFIKLSSPIAAPMVSVTGTRCAVANLTLQGGATASQPLNKGLLVNYGSSSVAVSNVGVTGTGGTAIKVIGSNVYVQNCNVNSNYGEGIFVTGQVVSGVAQRTSNVYISGNTVAWNVVGGNSAGQAGDGIALDAMTQYCFVEHNQVIGNNIILCDEGLAKDASGDNYSRYNTVAYNTITQIPQNGKTVVPDAGCAEIGVQGAEKNFTIYGNWVGNSTCQYGVKIDGPVMQGVVANNVVGPNGYSDDGIYVGNWYYKISPSLTGDATTTQVYGNNITANPNAIGAPVFIDPTSAAASVVSVGNTILQPGS